MFVCVLKTGCDFFSKLVIANQNSNSTSDKYESGLGVWPHQPILCPLYTSCMKRKDTTLLLALQFLLKPYA